MAPPAAGRLEHLRRVRGLSVYRVAVEAAIDQHYLARLERGQKTHPSRDVLIRICLLGLRCSLEDTDEILMGFDYAPLTRP
jgi:transcriptional regulator with XRE-family HTH domain